MILQKFALRENSGGRGVFRGIYDLFHTIYCINFKTSKLKGIFYHYYFYLLKITIIKIIEGGDGVIRHIQFRRPLHLSVLTGKHIHVPTFLNLTTSFIERRVFSPYGLHGGESTSSFLPIFIS